MLLKNIFIAGCIGMFQYCVMGGCYDSAIDCAQAITSDINDHELPETEPSGVKEMDTTAPTRFPIKPIDYIP